ncbi:MAG: DUF2961 domain-containing protein [Mariniphaga sp.]
MGTKENVNYCYIPMPFVSNAKIELLYRDPEEGETKELNFHTRIFYSNEKRNFEKEGKLYVEWNKDFNTQLGQPHTFLNVNGKGHFFGAIMQIQGLKSGMTLFFEGDDIAVVDGDTTIHGTGSEDFFNGGWYAFLDRWDTKMSLPLHGSLDYSLAACRTGGYRFYLTDKIPFKKNIKYVMENGPVDNNFPTENTTLGFYYCDTPPQTIMKPENKLSRVYLPDTLTVYPQLMLFNIWRDVDIKTEWCSPTGGYSYNFSVTNDSAIRILLDEIPYGNYKVFLDVNTDEQSPEISLWQRQTMVGDWLSLYQTEFIREAEMYVCNISIRDYWDTLTIRYRTKKDRNRFRLNRLLFVKIAEI